jgi:hypothetical protein
MTKALDKPVSLITIRLTGFWPGENGEQKKPS